MKHVLQSIGGLNLDAVLNCGQAFQWRRDAEGGWRGAIGGAIARVWQQGDSLACESSLPPELVSAYFRLDDDLRAIYATFPQDEVMRDAVAAFRGMRLVRQGLWECVISFICATNANIPRIDKMLAALCGRYGKPLDEHIRAFPDPAALAAASEEDLRALRLGYRAAYVRETADTQIAVVLNFTARASTLRGLVEEPGQGGWTTLLSSHEREAALSSLEGTRLQPNEVLILGRGA